MGRGLILWLVGIPFPGHSPSLFPRLSQLNRRSGGAKQWRGLAAPAVRECQRTALG
jgi:hypothetical protein